MNFRQCDCSIGYLCLGLKSMRRPRARAAIVPSFSDYSFGSGGTSESEVDRVPSFCEWLTALLCRPFRRRKPVVVPAQPEQSGKASLKTEQRRMRYRHYNQMRSYFLSPGNEVAGRQCLPSATVVAERLCFHRCLSVHGAVIVHPLWTDNPPRQTPPG